MKLSRNSRMSFDGQAALYAAYTFLIIQDSIYSQLLGLLNVRVSYWNSKVRYCLCFHVWVCVLFSSHRKVKYIFLARNHQSNHTRISIMITMWNEKYMLGHYWAFCAAVYVPCCSHKNRYTNTYRHNAHQYFPHQIDQFDDSMCL